MARRILRYVEPAALSTADHALKRMKAELSGYEDRPRHIYAHFQERMRAGSGLIVDETLSIDLVVGRICSEMRSRWGAD